MTAPKRGYRANRRQFGGLRLLPSKRWQASYTGPDGARHKAHSTYLRKGDAEAWLRDEELLIDRHEWTSPATRDPKTATLPTLGDYAETIIARRQQRARKPLRQSTADNYRKLIRLTIGAHPIAERRLNEITPRAVQAWYDALPADKPTQRGNAYNLLHSLFADAVHDGLIPKSPVTIRGAGKPKPKRTGISLTVPELLAYLDAIAPTGRMDAQLTVDRRVALMLAAWCSLRSGEVRALRRRDIPDDGSSVSITRTLTRVGEGDDRDWHLGDTKTDAGARTVATPPVAAQIITAWLVDWDERHPDATPDDLLFTALDGKSPMSESTLRDAHIVGRDAIGKPTLTIHDLRRTGATLAGQSGATVKELMHRLGHTLPQVAMIYQVADAQRDAAVASRMSALTEGAGQA